MGPIAGFVLSLIAVVVGLYLSEVKPLPAPTADSPILIFGDSILFALISRIIHGVIPHGYDVFLSPFAWAGWIGFLVTSLNLMPLGQLDGSHILYSLIGRKQIFAGWAAFTGLIFLSFLWPGWIVWIIMTLTFLKVGHPPVENVPELTVKEKVMGWTCMVIWVLTFIPSPVDIIEAGV
jgi:membrane-associated protease RseP (regulator of RpoE activity)